MHLEELRDYCMAKPGVTEGFPFGGDVLVFKVMGKMFALVNIETLPTSVNLKCDPERAIELREHYQAVEPGYHMNKQHWNTVALQADLPPGELRALVDHSYALVVQRLKKADRAQIGLDGTRRGNNHESPDPPGPSAS